MLKLIQMMVPVFLAFQAGFIYWAAGRERMPPKPDFSTFPTAVNNWKKLRDNPVEPAVAAQLGADSSMGAAYIQQNTAQLGDLFVAWFQSQRGGASQPHSPQVCLPGAGWVFEKSAVTSLQTADGPISINQDMIVQGNQRAVLLYWYQTPRRVIANEWIAKFWIVADSVRYQRTDTSLVRVIVWNSGRPDDETTASTREFAAKIYPALRDIFSADRLALR